MRLALLVLALLASPAHSGRRGEVATILPDRTAFTRGSFLAFASPQAAGGSDSISVRSSAFPNGTTINWAWPSTPCAGVCGYMEVTYGNYDSGVPQTPVTSRQAKNITTLTEEFNLSTAGDTTQFNVLDEFYLTSTQGDANTKVIEIGWFLNASASAVSYFNSVTQLGTYTDAYGRVWKVAQDPTGGSAGNYVMQMLANGSPLLVGAIDKKAALAFLTSQGKITGNEWFNGMAIGIEPVSGTGSMQVARWTVVYN